MKLGRLLCKYGCHAWQVTESREVCHRVQMFLIVPRIGEERLQCARCTAIGYRSVPPVERWARWWHSASWAYEVKPGWPAFLVSRHMFTCCPARTNWMPGPLPRWPRRTE